MTTSRQQEALSVLAEIWALTPDARLGQLFALLGLLGKAQRNREPGEISDDELLSVMKQHLTALKAQAAKAPAASMELTGWLERALR